SSRIDRSVFTDDSEHLNIESLIENLKNMIIKKLLILYIAEFSMSLSISSTAISLSVISLQSSTLISVFSSSAFAISVPVTSTLTTSTLITIFITNSLYFKKILHRLSELCFSRIISSLNSIKII
ncbi:hypothetical protein BDFG_06485, partial [Blastomyces dermatitidis ATCC 26199]